jgi:excisionase family DNA binding protein
MPDRYKPDHQVPSSDPRLGGLTAALDARCHELTAINAGCQIIFRQPASWHHNPDDSENLNLLACILVWSGVRYRNMAAAIKRVTRGTLTVAEAAARLKCPETDIEAMVARREIGGICINGAWRLSYRGVKELAERLTASAS